MIIMFKNVKCCLVFLFKEELFIFILVRKIRVRIKIFRFFGFRVVYCYFMNRSEVEINLS